MPDVLPGDRAIPPTGGPPTDSPDASPNVSPGAPLIDDPVTAPALAGDEVDDERCDALADLPPTARASAASALRRAEPERGATIDAALALAALLDRLASADADDRLADLAAARASGAPTATDRAVLAALDARMASDVALRARFDAFSDTAARLHANRAGAAARFEALVASAASRPAAPPAPMHAGAAASAAPARRALAPAADRASASRAPAPRMQWRTGVLAGLAVVAVAFAALRVALPPRLDLGATVLPEPSRSAAARVDAPRDAYDRAAAGLARAERTALGVSLGLDRSRIAAARAALDSVVAATPAASALHLDARFLRGVVCEATGEAACARREFTAVVDGQGPRTGEAAARLARRVR